MSRSRCSNTPILTVRSVACPKVESSTTEGKHLVPEKTVTTVRSSKLITSLSTAGPEVAERQSSGFHLLERAGLPVRDGGQVQDWPYLGRKAPHFGVINVQILFTFSRRPKELPK